MILRGSKLEKIIVFVLLTCLPIFFMPEMAWLAVQQQEGDVLLQQGKQDYMEGRFEDAIEKLTLASKLLTDKDKLIDAYLHLGLCHFALGERDKAKEQLVLLLNLNPSQRLDPLYYPPAFIELLEEAKEGILTQVEIKTDPPIAQVFIDGKLMGITPIELTEVAAGEHKLRVTKQDYKPYEASLMLKVGEKKTVSIKLEKEEKKPTVAVTPTEEKPEVKKKSNTWLWILLGGAAAAAVLILAGRGGGDGGGVNGSTGGSTGSINVSSNPSGAKIYLDGRDTGQKTNSTLTNVSVGSHTVKLILGGYNQYSTSVNVTKGGTARVNASLNKKNLTVQVKVTFKQSNMNARWIISIDGKRVFDDWVAAKCHGGSNPDYREITRTVTFARKVGQFTLELYGVGYRYYYYEDVWVWPTKFDVSITKPNLDKDLVRVQPNNFDMDVALWSGDKWPQKKTQKITISPDGTVQVQYQEPSSQEPLRKKLVP